VRRPLSLPLLIAPMVLTLLSAVPAAAQFGFPGPYPYFGPAFARYESNLRVTVTPNTAAVYVDGYFAGQVDNFDGVFQRLHLEPGQHEVVIYLPGHRSIRERIYFSPYQTRRLSGTLEPLAPGEADPGPPVPADPPPPTRNRRPGGALSRPGVPPPPRQPGPQPDPSRQSSLGTVSLDVQPGEADVRVGAGLWRTGGAGEPLLIQLPEGRHRIDVEKRGYRRFSTEVDVRAGETVPLNISLTRDQ